MDSDVRFDVIVLPIASKELDDIVRWLNARSPQGARNWLDSWEQALERLEKFANICQLAPEQVRHKAELRQIFFKTSQGRTYRALFTIREQSVLILHVRGQAQDLMKPREIVLPDD